MTQLPTQLPTWYTMQHLPAIEAMDSKLLCIAFAVEVLGEDPCVCHLKCGYQPPELKAGPSSVCSRCRRKFTTVSLDESVVWQVVNRCDYDTLRSIEEQGPGFSAVSLCRVRSRDSRDGKAEVKIEVVGCDVVSCSRRDLSIIQATLRVALDASRAVRAARARLRAQ